MVEGELPPLVSRLLESGVVMPAPELVHIGPDVDPDRIAGGTIIHPGCRLVGPKTSVGPGCELGAEQPVTLDDCRLGAAVSLRGGAFAGSTLLDGVSFASAAHVRPCTLLEEHASAGHAVGLKHTILMPWVTVGSLVNLCDCLVSGGTGRHDHGEVGSSYVHFNFSVHGDKATASLVGDVPRGAMLDQPPVFLGGQGGMVGPLCVAFGTVVAAGAVLRADQLASGTLVLPAQPASTDAAPFDRRRYRDPARVVHHNLAYIGNLRALLAWYVEARRARLPDDPWARACLEGAEEVLRGAVAERIARLAGLFDRLPESLARWQAIDPDAAACRAHRALLDAWPRMRDGLAAEPLPPDCDADRREILRALDRVPADLPWPAAVQSLSGSARAAGTRWLDAVVSSVTQLAPRTAEQTGAT